MARGEEVLTLSKFFIFIQIIILSTNFFENMKTFLQYDTNYDTLDRFFLKIIILGNIPNLKLNPGSWSWGLAETSRTFQCCKKQPRGRRCRGWAATRRRRGAGRWGSNGSQSWILFHAMLSILFPGAGAKPMPGTSCWSSSAVLGEPHKTHRSATPGGDFGTFRIITMLMLKKDD